MSFFVCQSFMDFVDHMLITLNLPLIILAVYFLKKRVVETFL